MIENGLKRDIKIQRAFRRMRCSFITYRGKLDRKKRLG